MLSKKIFLSIVYFLVFFLNASSTEWELEKSEKGIAIFTRFSKEKEYKLYKADTKVGYSIEDIKSILFNGNLFANLLAEVSSCEIIEEDEDYFFYHSFYDLKWPLDNRDVIAKVSLEHYSQDSCIIYHQSTPDKHPESKGMVRMRDAFQKWTLKKISDQETHVCFEGYVDPEGGIPVWLFNKYLIDIPYKTILNLKDLLESE